MFLVLCLFAVIHVSCSCSLSLENSSMARRVQVSAFYVLCTTVLTKNRCQSTSASHLHWLLSPRSAEETQSVALCHPRICFVSNRAGCCCVQSDAAQIGGGEERGLESCHTSVTPSLHAVLMGQDRMHCCPVALPMATSHLNNIAHSLTAVW